MAQTDFFQMTTATLVLLVMMLAACGAGQTTGAFAPTVASSTSRPFQSTRSPTKAATPAKSSSPTPGNTSDKAAATSVEDSENGIEGQVEIGPVSPVERQGTPNVKPYQATITVLNQAGETVITKFETDANGHFHVILKPGTYTVRPESPKRYPFARTQVVTVVEKRFTQVRISYESGIR